MTEILCSDQTIKTFINSWQTIRVFYRAIIEAPVVNTKCSGTILFRTRQTGEDHGELGGLIMPCSNIDSTSFSSSPQNAAGVLCRHCLIGCNEPVSMACSTTLVFPKSNLPLENPSWNLIRSFLFVNNSSVSSTFWQMASYKCSGSSASWRLTGLPISSHAPTPTVRTADSLCSSRHSWITLCNSITSNANPNVCPS